MNDDGGSEDKKKVVINVFQTKKPEPLPSVNEVNKIESKSIHESDKAKASIVGAFRYFYLFTLKIVRLFLDAMQTVQAQKRF